MAQWKEAFEGEPHDLRLDRGVDKARDAGKWHSVSEDV